MTFEADLLLDRRRLKRRLTLWRVLAVLAGLAAIWVSLPEGSTAMLEGDYVARLEIRGTIREDRRMLETIERAASNEHLRALIVAIDSPGGTVAGGEAMAIEPMSPTASEDRPSRPRLAHL
jgi:protease-4